MTPTARRRLRSRLRLIAEKAVSRSPRARALVRASLHAIRSLSYRFICSRASLDPALVVFECYAGRGYSCSPRAIYREMLADPRFAGHTFVWAFREPLLGALRAALSADDEDRAGSGLAFGPDAPAELSHAILVEYASREYYEMHARAGQWIANFILPTHMHVRSGQTYLQTWHGTPLKRLGCDIAPDKQNAMYAVREIHRRYAREGARFTHLVSPSPYTSARLGSAFGLSAEQAADVIIEQGYPRNDFLHTVTDAQCAAIKKRLGIPVGKTVILYAPTFRDDQRHAGIGYTIDTGIDLPGFIAQLGQTHVLLFRAHYLVASQVDFSAFGGAVIDVSDVSDINELYAVSDLLVTDYSSVFFDYANLGRPIIFFPYDLERYAEELRGFYLDISALPGPVVRTQAELAEAITALSGHPESVAETLERFRAEFLPLDDGHAARRVIDAVIDAVIDPLTGDA